MCNLIIRVRPCLIRRFQRECCTSGELCSERNCCPSCRLRPRSRRIYARCARNLRELEMQAPGACISLFNWLARRGKSPQADACWLASSSTSADAFNEAIVKSAATLSFMKVRCTDISHRWGGDATALLNRPGCSPPFLRFGGARRVRRGA